MRRVNPRAWANGLAWSHYIAVRTSNQEGVLKIDREGRAADRPAVDAVRPRHRPGMRRAENFIAREAWTAVCGPRRLRHLKAEDTVPQASGR